MGWFVRRWQVEVTFQEAREHLGIETQRQWSDRYRKPQPTFSDALAAVRRAIWHEQAFVTSRRNGDRLKRRVTLPEPWAYALCHAA